MRKAEFGIREKRKQLRVSRCEMRGKAKSKHISGHHKGVENTELHRYKQNNNVIAKGCPATAG